MEDARGNNANFFIFLVALMSVFLIPATIYRIFSLFGTSDDETGGVGIKPWAKVRRSFRAPSSGLLQRWVTFPALSNPINSLPLHRQIIPTLDHYQFGTIQNGDSGLFSARARGKCPPPVNIYTCHHIEPPPARLANPWLPYSPYPCQRVMRCP